MTDSDRPAPPPGPPIRPGRRALFSDPGEAGRAASRAEPAMGRRALFSSADQEPTDAPTGAGWATAVVHCRTCLAATPMSLPALGLSLLPSLWLPTRPWPRLMRCPACRRVSWCRIDWPFSPARTRRSGR